MIRVAIVEDEMLVRLGLRMCLESLPDIYVAGQFRIGADAAAAEETPADAVCRAELL